MRSLPFTTPPLTLPDTNTTTPPPQSALRLKPYFTDAYNNMASALVHKGLMPAAMECYAAALRINPRLVRAGRGGSGGGGVEGLWGVVGSRWQRVIAAGRRLGPGLAALHGCMRQHPPPSLF